MTEGWSSTPSTPTTPVGTAAAAIAWHVAPAAAREAILDTGLLVARPNPRWAKYDAGEQPAGVYLWDALARAFRWAHDFERLFLGAPAGACDVWAVDLAGIDTTPDPLLADQGALVVAADVPPSRIALVAGARA